MPETWLPPFVHPAPPAEQPPARPPRSTRVRVAWVVAAEVLYVTVDYFRPWTADELPRGLSALPHVDLYGLTTSVVVMAALCLLLPKVSHRRRDALLVVLPVLGLWVVGMTAWRLSNLPYRDWRPRDDELPRVRVLPGTRYHVLDPAEAP